MGACSDECCNNTQKLFIREGKVGGNGRRSGGVYTLALATLTSILDSLLKYILSANPGGMFSADTLIHNY